MSLQTSQLPAKTPDASNDIEAAYRYCRETTRAHAKSFYFCTQFLPRRKRRAIYAMYALCRHVDDAVDAVGAQDETTAQKAIAIWREELDAVYKGTSLSSNALVPVLDPVLIAWRDMLRRYAIKQDLPLELMRGVLMDTHIKRYETWAELRVYCYRVASVVGLMSSEIFGYTKPETLLYAEALGLAMQLTNILRDIGEDARMNRIYLPQEDMRRFDYTESELMRGELNDNFRELMSFQIERARAFYREAEKGIPLLNRDARFTVLLAARLYARILNTIERNDYDVWTRRAHLSLTGKLRAAPRIWRESRKL
jgi:phytoene synthase